MTIAEVIAEIDARMADEKERLVDREGHMASFCAGGYEALESLREWLLDQESGK